jgi:CBS domain containing-hemolysin-like protein
MHLSGEVVDTLADYIAIFVLVFVPALLIYLFWMVHILPEKIAERRGHPQADAIKTLCLLSLVFGGLLWPIAWLWAYSKPVLYKMAYGTDRIDHAPDAGDAHAVVVPPAADLATLGSGHHGAAALAATDLPALGTVRLER